MSEIIDNHELMEAFLEETQNLIDKMRKDLSTLSERLGAWDKGEPSHEFVSPHGETMEQSIIIRRIFRCLHIIKSSSASVGFDELKKVTQTLEKIFKVAEDEKLKINADFISLISESIEACQRLLVKEEVAGYKNLMERLNSILHS